MGQCISKKKSSENKAPSQAPNQQPNPPPVHQLPSVPAVPEAGLDIKFLFKPITDSNKAYLYNIKTPSVYQVPVSIPFRFRRACSVSYIENDQYLISGGYDHDNEMQSDTMLFDISTLSGKLMPECICKFASGTLLYSAHHKQVFLAGGLQSKLGDSNLSEICDFHGAEFCMFDLNSQKWEFLDPPPKQLCMPTCFLKENKIYLCGGFSSMFDELKFIVKSEIFIYDISKFVWTSASFDYQNPVVGSIAISLESKVLILGGMADPNTSSSKVFLLANNTQVQNLKDFQSPNLVIQSPELHIGGKILLLADPDQLITYDIKSSTISSDSLINMKKPQNDYFSLNYVNNPRSLGIYVYLPECGHKTIRDFNVISKEFCTHSFKTIQFRDAGVVVINDGRLFFAGGVGAITSKSTNHCFVFDPISGEEKEETQLPVTLRGVRLVYSQNCVFAIGGFNEVNERDVFNYCYTVNTKEWLKGNNLMQSVRSPTCFVIGNNLFAIGGEMIDEGGCESLSDCVQLMDLKQKVWSSKMVNYPHEAKSMGVIQLSKTSALIFGGEDNEGNSLNTCYLFNGEKFEKKSDLPDTCSTYNFDTTGITHSNLGYIFTMAGVLLQVDLTNNFEWIELDVEQEFTNRV